MLEGQSAAGLEPEGVDPASGAAEARRQAVEPAAVLLAVERVAADVNALGRALATQPEEVAARLDLDAAIAAVGVRVGALGSSLDQLRLSLLASLDRTADRLETPEWLAGLHVALTDIGSRLDAPPWLPELATTVDRLADDNRLERLDQISATLERLAGDNRLDQISATIERVAGDNRLDQISATLERLAGDNRLDQISATIERLAGDDRLDQLTAAVAAADPGHRLVRVEQAVAELADGVRAGAAVADALDHLGHRLAAIEDAAGRVAADARLLVERVAPVPDRLTAIAGQVDRITPLARAGDQAGSLFDHLERVGGDLQEAITLLRARGTGPDDDDDRFEGVVDVLAGVSRRQDEVSAAIGAVVDQVRGPRGADAVFERMEQRERSLAARLDRIDAELRRRGGDLGPSSSAAAEAKTDIETARRLESVAAAVEEQGRALTRRLDQIEARLQATAPGSTGAGQPAALGAVLERMDRQEHTVAAHLDWVGQRLAEVAAHLVPEGSAMPRPRRPASAEDAALRLARVRAERAQVQARLQEERLLAKTRRDET